MPAFTGRGRTAAQVREALIAARVKRDEFERESRACVVQAAVLAEALAPVDGWRRDSRCRNTTQKNRFGGRTLREEAVIAALSVGATIALIRKASGATRSQVATARRRAINGARGDPQ